MSSRCARYYEAARRRPFNRENPFVDLELEPGVRFHGEGFDVVQRPLITIRRAAIFGMSLDDLCDRGMLDDAAAALLRAAVAADMNVLVCGRMGSGKTTLLRCLNGLEEFQSGEVRVGAQTIVAGGERANGPSLHAIRQRVGMVFQQWNLFAHRTALGNVIEAPMRGMTMSVRPMGESFKNIAGRPFAMTMRNCSGSATVTT